MDGRTDRFPLCSTGLRFLWSAALLPLNFNHTLLKHGTGTTDHLLPLWCYHLLFLSVLYGHSIKSERYFVWGANASKGVIRTPISMIKIYLAKMHSIGKKIPLKHKTQFYFTKLEMSLESIDSVSYEDRFSIAYHFTDHRISRIVIVILTRQDLEKERKTQNWYPTLDGPMTGNKTIAHA